MPPKPLPTTPLPLSALSSIPAHSPSPSRSPMKAETTSNDQQLAHLLANATIAPKDGHTPAPIVPGASKIQPPPLPATQREISKEALTKRLEQIQQSLNHVHAGALRVSSRNFLEGLVVRIYFGGHGDESFFKRPVSDGTSQAHAAFKLLKAKDVIEVKNWSSDSLFEALDLEIMEKYEGVVPGTVTAEAFGREMSLLAKPVKKFSRLYSTAMAPGGMTVQKIVARLGELQRHGLGHSLAADREKAIHEDLNEYIISGTMWLIPNDKYNWQNQTNELILRLNNEYVFKDLTKTSSFLITFLQMGFASCFYQILLATELRLRLDLFDRGGTFDLSNSSTIQSSLIISKRWQDHVCVTIEAEKDSIQWRSNVHEQQIDGLLRFADTMGWPYMESLRPVAETSYAKMISGGHTVNNHIWDWIYGVMLPGKYASFKIMTALVMLTPETKDLKEAPFYNSGLVVEGCSFWRLKSILGRVLGGSPGATGLMHWVGPCPPVIEGLDDGVKLSWVLVKTRPVGDIDLVKLERSSSDESILDMLVYFGNDGKNNPEKAFQELEDKDNWVPLDPLPPLNQADAVKFSGLKLRKNPLDASVKEPTNDDYNYTAIIQMDILGRIETFTLYTDVYFVASHPCIGTHSVHKRQLPGIKRTVVSVKDLKNTRTWKDELYINVQGQEDAEIAARAWCSERGYHALVKHEDTCDVCLRHEAYMLNLKVIVYR
ncbi:hypothetical protein DM01DRAFT_1394555 [Hesseltinella vesiculosa]|uniref:Uncharacterized protein n=1 Tax=Hesseltinella vesiculosa TaxID=101127 RepID=A0A1X2G9X3_9FUNG|nr:hypothetical protein DM01DRAFT_1394555 [Hesseltinella vesiculosa]